MNVELENIMLKSIVCLLSAICLCGCEDNDEVKTRKPAVVDPVSHIQVIWKERNMEMDRIDGHVYLVGKIGSSARGGSYGVASIVHAPDCPCQKKDTSK